MRKVGKQVGELITGTLGENPIDPAMVPGLQNMLGKYSEALNGWAEKTAGRMLADVDRRDQMAWLLHAEDMGRGIAEEIKRAPTGQLLRGLMSEQVALIKSIPIEAAKRVHELTIKGLEDSTRYQEIAAEIMRSGEVAQSRATLIARTEVSRTAAKFSQARAQSIGVTEYIWRTSGDGDVRPGHKAMNGKVCRYDSPPAVDENGRVMHHGPGEIWNCRCWGEPIIPDDFE